MTHFPSWEYAQKAVEAAREGFPRVEMIDKGIPRHGYKVFKDGTEIGEITTGTQLPSSKRNVGFALIDSKFTELGTEVEIEIRNKKLKSKIVTTPFYKRSK